MRQLSSQVDVADGKVQGIVLILQQKDGQSLPTNKSAQNQNPN